MKVPIDNLGKCDVGNMEGGSDMYDRLGVAVYSEKFFSTFFNVV